MITKKIIGIGICELIRVQTLNFDCRSSRLIEVDQRDVERFGLIVKSLRRSVLFYTGVMLTEARPALG
jgi:predicted AAA+ superfamily ATPase